MFHNGDHKIYYIKWLHINILKYISSQNAKLRTGKILQQGQALLNHHQTKHCHIHLLKVKNMNEKMTVMRYIDRGWKTDSLCRKFCHEPGHLMSWCDGEIGGKGKLSSNNIFTIKSTVRAPKWFSRLSRQLLISAQVPIFPISPASNSMLNMEST